MSRARVNAPRRTDGDAGEDEDAALLEHHRSHIATLRSQGHADADRLGAQADDVGHHSVDADRAQEKR
jgi:hypothetical protein